jgi:hypothetical protein
MSETPEQVLDCECGDPTSRDFIFADWDKAPARLYWACECGSVGILLVQHRRLPAGANAPTMASASVEELAGWRAVEVMRERQRNRYAPVIDAVVRASDLRQAVEEYRREYFGEQVRRIETERDQLALARSEASESLDRMRARYVEMRRRLEQWHRARSARLAHPEPAMTVLIDGSEGVAVYALVDPVEPARVRYVGKTVNPLHRHREHCRFTPWAQQLVAAGRTPTMLLIEWAATDADALDREAFWINHYRGLGMADVNMLVPRMVAA